MRRRIADLRQRGIKVGTCVPVLCEIEAGIQQVSKPDVYRLNLERLLRQIRVWPIDLSTARLYGVIHHDLKQRGRVLSHRELDQPLIQKSGSPPISLGIAKLPMYAPIFRLTESRELG